MSVTPLEAVRTVEARLHGLKVKLGKARAAARRAPNLSEKVGRYRKAREIEQQLELLRRTYWEEVEKLENGDLV